MTTRGRHTLEELTAHAMERPPSQPAIEFQGRWVEWGAIRHLAERLGALIDASDAAPGAPVAFVPARARQPSPPCSA